MAQLNFPSNPQTGAQYTGDNDVTYIYDGSKWIGHAVAQPAGTNSIVNNSHVVQVDPTGNLVIPTGATIIYQSGAPVVSTSTLINGSYSVSLGLDGYLNLVNGADGQGALVQSASPIRINSNGNFWTFGANGTLTLPGGIAQGTGSDFYWSAPSSNDSNHWGSYNVNWGVDGFNASLQMNKNNLLLATTGLPINIITNDNSTNHTWTFGTDGYLTGESLHLQGFLKGVDGSTGSTGQVLTRQSNGGVAWADATGGSGGSGGPVFQLSSGTTTVTLNTYGQSGVLNISSSTYIAFNGTQNIQDWFAIGILDGGLENASTSSFVYSAGAPFNITTTPYTIPAVYNTWTFNLDGSLTVPGALLSQGNLPITTVNIPTLASRNTNFLSDGTVTTVTDVIVANNSVIVLMSGAEVATSTNTVSTIVSVVGFGLEWTRRAYYEDPSSTNHQRAEIWYAINNSGSPLRDNITVTFDNPVDDQGTIVTSYLGCNLNNPWSASGPVYSNSLDVNNSATVTLSIAEPNSTGLVFFGVPWNQGNSDGSPGVGYALNWTNVAEADNGGAIMWEYDTLSLRQFINPQSGLVVTSKYNGVPPNPSYTAGLTIIADALVGIGSSTWSLGANLEFPDGTIQNTAWTGYAQVSNLINGEALVSLDPFGVLHLQSGGDIVRNGQSVLGGVEFRAITGPTGAAGDIKGTLVFNTLTNSFYIATDNFVAQTSTSTTATLTTNQTILNGQDINGNLGFAFTTSDNPSLAQTLYDIAVGNLSGTITLSSPALTGVRSPALADINYGIDRSSFYIQVPYQSGDPSQIDSGTPFTVTVTYTPAQPVIWNQIANYDSRGFLNLPTNYGIIKNATTNSNIALVASGNSYNAYVELAWTSDTNNSFNGQYPDNDPKANYLWVDQQGAHIVNSNYTTSTSYSWEWDFKTDGSLQLPNSTTISDADGTLNIYTLNTATIRAGAASWWTQYGDITNNAYNNWGTSCAYDSQGNAYVVGTVQKAVGGGYNGGGNAPFFESVVIKYNQHGAIQWQEAIGDYAGGTGNAPPFVTGESIYIDANDNLYVLGNEFTDSGSYVFRLNTHDGSIVSQEYFAYETGVFSSDLVVDSTGTVYVIGKDFATDNSILYSVSADLKTINWEVELGNGKVFNNPSNQPGSYYWGSTTYSGGVAVDLDSNGIYICGQAGDNSASTSSAYTAAYDFSGNLLWQTQPFGGTEPGIQTYATSVAADKQGNVYTTGFAVPGPVAISTVVKHTNTGTTVWESVLANQANVIVLDINVGSDGFLYLTGQAPAPNNSQLWWAKMDPVTGNILFQRFFTGWWGGVEGGATLNGHRMAAVHNGKLLLNGWTFSLTTGTTATNGSLNQANFITLQVPTDGSDFHPTNGGYNSTGTQTWYGTYLYSDTDFWNGVGTNTTTVVSTGTDIQPGILTTSTVTYSTQTSYAFIDNFTATAALSAYTYTISGADWNFDKNGITFPDGTVQTTAYVEDLESSEFEGKTASSGNANNLTVAIKNLTGYKRIVGLNNSAQTWFDFNTVASELHVPPAWISGAVIDFQLTSTGFGNQGNMVGQIILATYQNVSMTVSHSESAMTSSNSSSDLVFTNLNMWQTNGVTLEALRTDSNGGQQLDIIWTARVFINQVENYC